MPVVARNRLLTKIDKHGKYKGDLCNQVEVEANIIDLISGDTRMNLKVFRSNGEDYYLMDRKNFDIKNFFEFLNSKNVKILDELETKTDVYSYVSTSDLSAPDVYEHKQLGFVTINGELCFLAHHPIGLSDPDKATSTFHNPQVTEPVGTMDRWLDLVNTEVIGNTKLELALALAALGPVTYFLRLQKVIQTNPAINIAGRSSIGKTTFLRICASVFGSPDEATGLISDLHATENAFSARLARCHGLPVLCDESTLQPDWDFTKFGYAVSKGVDKLRCNQDGSLKNQNMFFSPLIITGETKLLDKTQKNEGLYARFVTISQPLTDSAEQAERITSACSANYGHAVYPLIEWLLKNHSCLSEVYKSDVEDLKGKVESSNKGVDFRILKSYALIITAARIARQVWQVNINTEKMRKFLLSIFNEQLPEASRISDLYEKIMSGVAANQSMFAQEKEENSRFSNSDYWGKYATYNYQSYVYVSTTAISTILKDDRALDTITLKELYAKGLIKRFGDRYKKAILLGKTSVACYCFLAKYSEPPVNKKKKAKKKSLPTPQIKYLLTDDDDDKIVEVTEDGNFNFESRNIEQPTGNC